MPRKLNPLLRTKLEKLADAGGAAPLAPGDFDELIVLNELAYRVTQPGPETTPRLLLDLKARCGNVTLYALSLGAWLWYQDIAQDWWPPGSYWDNLLSVFVSAHSRQPEIFDDIQTKHQCKRAMRRWLRHCSCTSSEMLQACAVVMRMDQAMLPDEEQKDIDYGPVLRFLTKEHGGTIDWWMWGESLDRVRVLLESRHAEILGEAKAVRKGAQKTAPDADCPWQKANKTWFDGWKVFEDRKRSEFAEMTDG
jgi:hypothetical protein